MHLKSITYIIQNPFLIFIQFSSIVLGDGPEVVSYHHLGQEGTSSQQHRHVAVHTVAERQQDEVRLELKHYDYYFKYCGQSLNGKY